MLSRLTPGPFQPPPRSLRAKFGILYFEPARFTPSFCAERSGVAESRRITPDSEEGTAIIREILRLRAVARIRNRLNRALNPAPVPVANDLPKTERGCLPGGDQTICASVFRKSRGYPGLVFLEWVEVVKRPGDDLGAFRGRDVEQGVAFVHERQVGAPDHHALAGRAEPGFTFPQWIRNDAEQLIRPDFRPNGRNRAQDSAARRPQPAA